MSEPINNPLGEGSAAVGAYEGASLSYETPVPVLKRVAAGAFVGASHAAAVLFTFLFWWIVPFVIFVVYTLVQTFVYVTHPVGDSDMPKAYVPVVLIIAWLVGVLVSAAMSAMLTLLAFLMAVGAEVFRRRYRWPFWTMPFTVAGISILVWPLLFIPFGASVREGVRLGMLVAGGISCLFLFYWVVLFFSEQALLLIKWAFGSLGDSIKKWWQGNKPEKLSPHEPGI